MVKVLNLEADSPDCKEIIEWRERDCAGNLSHFSAKVRVLTPSSQTVGVFLVMPCPSGSLLRVSSFLQAQEVCVTRKCCRGEQPGVKFVSVAELNECLDMMSSSKSAVTEKMKDDALRDILTRLRPHEPAWLFSIILARSASKNTLRLRFSVKLCLRFIHENAEPYYRKHTNLRDVCRDIPSSTVVIDASAIPIAYGMPLEPQLCGRTEIEKAVKKADGQDLIVENKFDGWRMQARGGGWGMERRAEKLLC